MIEFKTLFQKEIIESIVAFANIKGGKIFIGVKDNGRVVDVKEYPIKSIAYKNRYYKRVGRTKTEYWEVLGDK